MYFGPIWDSPGRWDVEQGRRCGFGERGRMDEWYGRLGVRPALLLAILHGCPRAESRGVLDLFDDGHGSE